MSQEKPKATLHCTNCGMPVGMRFSEALSFDTQWIYCGDCRPRTARQPRVTLYGEPEGQEMQRWNRD